MKKTILIFSSLIFALLILFQLSKYYYAFGNISIEIILAIIAVVFFLIGISINKKSLHKNKLPKGEINSIKIKEIGLSKREYEVLCKIADGLSNQEIANQLFVTESTIKTHVSNLLIKLNAKRRTHAIQKAKKLQIIAF